MKKTICIIFCIINFSLFFSQTKEIVLIIDTIQENIDFVPKVSYGGFANIPKDIEIETFSSKNFPNFISKNFLIHDTSTIYIPLSNRGDFIEIKEFKKIRDTIRINKIPMIESTLADTTYTIKYWYREKNDSLVPLLNKTEISISISKTQITKLKSEISLIINGEKYSSPLIIVKGKDTILIGTGTVPKKPNRKNGQRKKNVKIFKTYSETKHWIYKAIIRL